MSNQSTYALLGVACALTYQIVAMVLAYQDARARGRSGLLIALFVGCAPFVGSMLWLAARPDLPDTPRPKRASHDPDADLKSRANAGQL